MIVVPDFAATLQDRRDKWPWFDHTVRAATRYQAQKGDYYAAGMTYFSVLALFPLLMVAFAAAGFILVGQPEWLDQIRDQIAQNVPGSFGETINSLIDTAVESRTSVGIIGLLGALYAGLGWIANLREALTAMWEFVHEPGSFLATKLKDFAALVGLGLALALSLGLSALNGGSVMRSLLELANLDQAPGVGILLRVVSVLLALAATWAVMTWVISRLPREPVPFRSAVKGGLIAAVGFEIFKQIAAIYLASVTNGPAGVVFGPIIGLLVFVFTTSRFILFATAFAATTRESMALAYVPPPEPAVINTRVEVNEGPTLGGGIALVGAGALAAVGLGFLNRRR
ncbi:inner membrane protein YhjD [Rhodococcus sp. RS1C4]|uniref:inner membrane protein YhjD n=1 Tax=Nocardiaceae TaxID=85025 RepID=UPI00037B1EAA|nr:MULTISPECIES: inner membrane protein YhjD [Rhodococcus]OZC46377.1 inner membrane protein YhjD [Rhodococcus sp. 06-621-2]OZC59414.1 inner membrane protein YhjD [Rhodococcus sp. RS1C4]OZC81713.1 inner membrane protein YhjD [Rhodococcus sp. 06-418-1B]OZD10661.1 inner membrane protein YhjD [Rhodococcus sp. 06-156-4C]OZD26931.1 inner membrane protein YhjD [Rhodococcus sp. 06-156-4a]